MSEFGKVLKENGWTFVTDNPDRDYWSEYRFKGERNTYQVKIHHETGDQILNWWPSPACEHDANTERVDDEHQAISIVAAIEGADGWRSMGSLPEDTGRIEALSIRGVDFVKVHKGEVCFAFLDIPEDQYTFFPWQQDEFLAWRPYNPANWDVAE